MISVFRTVSSNFLAERERWFLWTPVALGAGIALYFALTVEPPWWLGGAVAAPLLAALWLLRRRQGWVVALVALGAVAAGFTLAQARTWSVAAPMIQDRLGPVSVDGRVVEVDPRPDGRRVTLEHPRVSRLRPDRLPARVRVRLRGEEPVIFPGDWIRLRAVLDAPGAPPAPGAFDFQRRSFFRQLGGVGYALGGAEVIARAGADGGPIGFLVGLSRLRQAIATAVREALPGPTGAVAAALMTGHKGAIPEPVMDRIRDAGLAHLLAISGLHIGLVAGILFVGLRALMALAGPLALRAPIKKWTAVAAILGAFAYALVAGATVPTLRAFLMIGLMLAGVVFDRRGLSVRSVAWAATVLLVLQPESLLGASFQLSFAAVTALIAVYEGLRGRRFFAPGEGAGWARRPLGYVAGVGLTTLVAGAATAPFVVYHFNRIAAFGLVANLAAVPVAALWIMPWAVVAFALMPFGLHGLALVPMGWGIDGVLAVAGAVAAWPGAVHLVPAMPTWGLALVTLGGLWLCLWRRPWRWLGLAGAAAGLLSVLTVTPPDILVGEGGRLMAVRGADGVLSVSTRRGGRFDRETWLRRAGQEAAPLWPHEGASGDGRMVCDFYGCIYRKDGITVALVRREEALFEDCWVADVVVSTVPVARPCARPRLVIGPGDLRRAGGHALWIGGGRVRAESVDARRGDRPWVVRPPAPRTGPPAPGT